METVLVTLLQQHDLRLVVLAAIVCSLSAFAGITLLTHARRTAGIMQRVWLAIAAVSVGFGIWATHFVAMLSFHAGMPVGYDLPLTLVSLSIAILIVGGGLWFAALGTRASIPVKVEAAGLTRRPAPVVESAAYFVVAESLTNVAKHAPGAAATVTLRLDDEMLEVTIADDGPGGAEVSEGSGLDGLRRRVAALDGEMRIVSPATGGTRIEVRLPCGS